VGYTVSSLGELGEGYGFRKVRAALGVTAFGVNAIVFPPRYEGPNHFHDRQDELYFVHRGTATFTFDETDERVVEAGGLVHVEASTHRQISNRTDDDLTLLIFGGKDGYVDRDGHLVNPEIDLPRRQGL
jgi:mannose-6-phosphate isomerase-like protein (cupin superfamily)